jgi:hypothetical protein|tara:strand:+ start:1886 stop:2353 length:468 start_codon:yes stop_codon:yes gene_type:complete
MVSKDKLVQGPFGGNACYEQTFDKDGQEVTTWLCFGSGFTTSTMLTKGSKLVEDTIETSPELYRDLMFEDKENRVWIPATITLPAKGMVFVDGTSKDDWQWTAVKAIEITEEDRKLKNYPENQQYRMDMANSKKFSQKDFMDALEVIGFYEQQLG